MIFYAMAYGGSLIFLVTLSCCSPDSNSLRTTRKTTEANGSVMEQNERDILSIILSLPEFRYHEESRNDFERRLHRARKLPQNFGNNQNYFYCPSDGTFPAREFILDQDSGSMKVRILGTDVEPPQVDTWRQVQGKWMEQ